MALGTWFLNNSKRSIIHNDTSAEQIAFVVGNNILPEERYFKDDFLLMKDKSLLYSKSSGDYSVFLGGNWRFELIIDSSTGLCIKIQCFLDELDVSCMGLELPKFQRKRVYVASKEPLSPACGCHYFPFRDAAYWDSQKYILCIGDPNSAGESVEFSNKTIAVIEKGKLMCVYLVLDSLTGYTVF